MWRLVKLGFRFEPSLMFWAFALSLLAALPDALLALWLALLGKAVLAQDNTLVVASALALGISAAATWFLRTISTRVQRRFRDKVTIALESHVARLQASVVTIAHQERPEYLDRLSVLRDQVFVLDHMYMSVFTTAGWILRLIVTIVLLASIHPALVLLAVFALPTVLTSAWRPAVEREANERGAQAYRRARHLFQLATTAAPSKEVRVTGIGERLIRERRQAWEGWYAPVSLARSVSAVWHTLAWAIFGGAYVGAVVFVSSVLRGDVEEHERRTQAAHALEALFAVARRRHAVALAGQQIAERTENVWLVVDHQDRPGQLRGLDFYRHGRVGSFRCHAAKAASIAARTMSDGV